MPNVFHNSHLIQKCVQNQHLPLPINMHQSLFRNVARGKIIGLFFFIISVNLECGAETAENTTFISQAAKTTFNSEDQTCTYKICSMNPNVARIRFDFTVSA